MTNPATSSAATTTANRRVRADVHACVGGRAPGALVEVVARDVVPVFHESTRHRAPHPPESDDADAVARHAVVLGPTVW
jgi:hypothetical protein